MLLYGNPNRDYLETLKKNTYLDTLLPELLSSPYPDPNTQEAIDEINQLISYTDVVSKQKELHNRYKLYDVEYNDYIIAILSNKGIDFGELSYLRSEIFSDISPLILKTKYHYGRVRPNQLAILLNMGLYPFRSLTIDTPSYPSGHTIMAEVFCTVLGNRYPQFYNQLKELSKDISESRLYLGIHYPSDVKFGNYIAELILNHPDFKKKYKL